jgi:hypothetical protein
MMNRRDALLLVERLKRRTRDSDTANALAVKIRPPFGTRANAAMVRSMSPASRMLIALTSTPTEGATDWMMANWPTPGPRFDDDRDLIVVAVTEPVEGHWPELEKMLGEAFSVHRSDEQIFGADKQVFKRAKATKK